MPTVLVDHPDRTIMASRFKAECLAILDQVEQLRITVTVTKHGRPVDLVVPHRDGTRQRAASC
jgi:antitoxin (DNA-binding transcriptional repressor) of toxin-antitoxin stability system